MSIKVICIKLSSGEEIIGRFEGTSVLSGNTNMFDGKEPWDLPPSNIVLKDVRIISIQPMQGGQVGIAFIPWMVANPDGTIMINRDHITGVTSAQDALEKGYLGETTGIQLAGAQAQSKVSSIKKH